MLQVMAGERPERPSGALEPTLPDHIWNIAEQCWKQDYAERPIIVQVLDMMRSANPDFVV